MVTIQHGGKTYYTASTYCGTAVSIYSDAGDFGDLITTVPYEDDWQEVALAALTAIAAIEKAREASKLVMA